MLPRYQRPNLQPVARTNDQIRVPEVRLISAEGQQIGVMPTQQALAKARQEGLDMVEVNPNARPPVVKLINFDKYRYQQMKLAQAQRKNQKKIDVKGIRVSSRIGLHDMEVKARAADKFLGAGDKVKLEMLLRGRELANIQFAMEQMRKFLGMITTAYVTESPVKKLGNMITAILAPK